MDLSGGRISTWFTFAATASQVFYYINCAQRRGEIVYSEVLQRGDLIVFCLCALSAWIFGNIIIGAAGLGLYYGWYMCDK